ncbi:MAG TPA: hypothetical protein VHA52_03575, partial [Candidatus Babeliaceae bacterium]|nr:hypothetical protein [Candidatus Babeliaceae bacterium]
KIAPERTTGDIDFAVLINDTGIYEQLKEYLIEKENFSAYSGNAFVLIWQDGTEVDLLPFGALEDENRKVTVSGTGYSSVHVDGFKEVYEEGLPTVELENNHSFKFCTLPGIVLLKLVAWDDRPEERRDDIKDIAYILLHFFDMYQETIWAEHNDLFMDDANELPSIAARVMGREIRKITERSDALHERIASILNKNTEDLTSSRAAEIMVEVTKNEVSDNFKLLEEINKGFLGG